MLHRNTVTSSMMAIAQTVIDSLDKKYYLAGGTALALRIGHRTSVDLDYFINSDIDTKRLQAEIVDVFTADAVQVTFEEKNTLWLQISGVKVSFITRKEELLTPVDDVEMFRLASVDDLTIMKLSAICGREEYKDYFDLACISKREDVRRWVPMWQKTYPNADPISWIIALSAVGEVAQIPLDVVAEYAGVNVQNDISTAVVKITKLFKKLD